MCTDPKVDTLTDINDTTSKKTKTALAMIQEKVNNLVSNIKSTMLNDTTINSTRDGIISNISQYKAKVKQEIKNLNKYIDKDKNKIITVLDHIKSQVNKHPMWWTNIQKAIMILT